MSQTVITTFEVWPTDDLPLLMLAYNKASQFMQCLNYVLPAVLDPLLYGKEWRVFSRSGIAKG